MTRSTLALLLVLLAPGCTDDRSRADLDGPPPTAAERLAGWATLPEDTSVPVALGFSTTVPDPIVMGLLERYGLRPYAVYMEAADLAGSHRRERNRASLEVLAEGREQTIAQLRTSLCAQRGRARAMLAQPGEGDATQRFREVL